MIYHPAELDVQEILKNNDRFYSAKVVIKNKAYFYKKSKNKSMNIQIQQQVRGAELLQKALNEQNINWLKTETISSFGDDWLMTEWLDQEPLAKPSDYVTGQNLDSINSISKIQIALDSVANTGSNEAEVRVGGNTLLSEAEQKQQEKLKPLLLEHGWDAGLINDATSYWVSKSNAFEPALQHADLTPWHIYPTGKTFTIIDCEHVSDDWPRYYDIANFYSALNTRFSLPEQAKSMAQQFSEARHIDLLTNDAFLGVMVLRNIFRLVEHQSEPKITNRIFGFTKQVISQ